MPEITEPRVSRPTPTWSWENRWAWRGRYDIHGKRSLEVRAIFSTNEDKDPEGLPNEIVIDYVHGQADSRDTVRMSRDAAAKLIEQLQAALDWDGR